MTFADLRNAKIKFSSDTRMITDFPLDDFIDWAQFTKDTFFALRKIASLSEGLGPEAGIPVGGVLDLVGFPDFLTYYDKLIDEALKALKRIGDIQARIAKNGDYWLEYTRKNYTLRCEPHERCQGGRWVPFGKFSVTYDGDEPGQTQRIQALGDHRTIEREVQRVIDRLFRELERMNHAAESASRTAQTACGA